MNIPIGLSGGLPRWAGLLIIWGLTIGCLCLAAYEWAYPGQLVPSGRTQSLFFWAREHFGSRGVAWVYLALAGIAVVFAFAAHLSLKQSRDDS